jgi:hypothetical protein
MSSNQEYWDACLIRTWRNHGTTIDAFIMFMSIQEQDAQELGLLRCPQNGTGYSRYCRAFVASRLPKISDWLLKIPADKDALLLKKLSSSKYDIQKESSTLPDPEKKALYAEKAKNRHIIEYNTTKSANRNSDTDGNVMRGTRIRRAR